LDLRALADLLIAGFRSIRAENEFKAWMAVQQFDADQETTWPRPLHRGRRAQRDAPRRIALRL
jgi:hypothetical protein